MRHSIKPQSIFGCKYLGLFNLRETFRVIQSSRRPLSKVNALNVFTILGVSFCYKVLQVDIKFRVNVVIFSGLVFP